MNNLFKTYNREIETHEERKLVIFTVFFLINLVVFGYYGVFIGIKSYLDKRDLVSTLESTNLKVAENLETTKNLADLVNNSEEFKELDVLIPSDSMVPQMFLELGEAAQKNRFILTKFSASKYREDYVEISIELEGPFDKLPNLYSDIESIERLTQLGSSKLLVTRDDETMARVSTTIKVFYAKVSPAEVTTDDSSVAGTMIWRRLFK